MALEEVVNQLETYVETDFNNTATFEPASPLCITRVLQHKDETYSANGSQPRKHIIKIDWQTQAEKIMNELFGDNDARRVLISDTLSADMNFSLPAGMSTPDNILQVFVIGESLPCFVVTLYNALKENANPGDQKGQIHKFTVSTIKRLKSSLLNFCHDEFAILPCTLDKQNFDAESLKQELQTREDNCQQFYDGPIRLETTVFKNLAQAAVLQQGTSCVPCFMPTRFKGFDTDEVWLFLLDEKWRNIVQLLIVAMTHTGQSSGRIPCRSALKMEVAILETAFRVGRSQLVTIKSSNAEVNDCVTKLITKGKCNARLEQSGELDGSFQVISQQSTLTFKEIKGIATVTLTANQDLTSVEDGMDKTLVGNKIETAVKLPVSKEIEMTSVEDESGTEIDERQNKDTAAVASSTSQNLTPVKEARTRDFINSALTDDEPGPLCPGQGTTSMETGNEIITLSMSQADEMVWARSIKISGIPEDGKKNTKGKIEEVSANCQNDVLEFLNDKLGLDLQTRDVKKVCRFGENRPRRKKSKGHGPRPILILFASEGKRDAVFKHRSMLDGSGFRIEEYLPFDKLCLLRKTQRNPNCKDAWSEDGKIYMVQEIRSSSDLPDMITKVQTGDVTHKYDKKGEQLDDQKTKLTKSQEESQSSTANRNSRHRIERIPESKKNMAREQCVPPELQHLRLQHTCINSLGGRVLDLQQGPRGIIWNQLYCYPMYKSDDLKASLEDLNIDRGRFLEAAFPKPTQLTQNDVHWCFDC